MFRKLLVPLLILIFFTSCKFGFSEESIPRAEKGVLDLRNWDFQSSLPLSGEWEFYKDVLMTPEDFVSSMPSETQYAEVPHLWNIENDNESELSPFGAHTYRLKILVNDPEELYALKIQEIFTAYRLWIDEEEVFASGKTATEKSFSCPYIIPHTTPLELKSESYLIIQVSNFHYKDGGIKDPIYLGKVKNLQLEREKSILLNYFLFGALVIMGIYHFGLYILKRNDRSTLFFGLYCLLTASRILVTGESLVLHLLPWMSWQLRTRIIVAGYYLAFPTVIAFIFSLFPQEINRKILRAIITISLFFAIFPLFTPILIFTRTETVFQLIIVISSLYILTRIVKAAFRKKEGSRLMLTGIIVLFLASLNDILYAQHISKITTIQSLLPLGLFVFIIIQAYILSVRFSKAYREAVTDDLCGIFNRRMFLKQAEIEMERAKRSGTSITLLTIDVDYFKSVNDNYGHSSGDKVLKALSHIISSGIRKVDVFGRIGGEEFALLLPETELEQAVLLAERLRKKLEKKQISLKGKESISITISLGLANYNRERHGQISLDQLMNESDQALYKAKHNGRNRTESFQR